MLVDAHHHQLLDVPILVLRQWRVEIEGCDFVFVEKRSDNLVRMLASEHCAVLPTVELSAARAAV
jgi:hypothetical protein